MKIHLVIIAILLAVVHAEPLLKFSSCSALTEFYREEAVSRVTAYGLPGVFSNRRFFNPILQSAPQAEDNPQAGVDFSETNVQVEGVDEPDIVKTDGKRVYIVAGNDFYIVDVVENGAAGKVVGKLELPTYSREMLIEGDDVLILGTDYGRLEPNEKESKRFRFGVYWLILPFGQEITVVYRVSVKGDKPTLKETLRMEGRYVNAREVNGVARIVTTSTPGSQIDFVYPEHKKRSEKEAKMMNQEIIKNTTTGMWLSRYVLLEKGKKVMRGFTAPCTNVFKPMDTFPGFKLLTVTTLPLKGPLVPSNSVSIGSDGDDVYSTAETLYVATTQFEYDASKEETGSASFTTSLHKFKLSNTGQTYVGSGEVTGSLLNQFSMHEYKGVFYAATTDGARWWGSRDTSVSKVTAFGMGAGKLVQQGSVGNLGVGERIYAVRYIQDSAYVVTFREVDPLYVIDLNKLKVTGELKIPGFSSYLHPIGPGLLLGVGREATDTGRVIGAKVSLFDVGDVTKPTELSTWTLEGGFSNAEWDHRAFLYWEPEGIAVMPVASYGKKRFVGSIVLEVSKKGIKERGRIVHPKCCGKYKSPQGIMRNFVLGRVYLWSLSREQLQVNGIMDLRKLSLLRLK